MLDAFARSVDDSRNQGEGRKPGNADAIEQGLVGDIPRNGGEGEEPDQVAVERRMRLSWKASDRMRREIASGAWIHQSFCAGMIRAIERGMASSKPAKGSVAREVAICARSGNYRSVLFGLFRASAKGGEISLFRSASRLKSAIGCRSSVLSTALRRHSFMSKT